LKGGIASRTTAHAGHATHAAELGEVLLGSLVLLVLVDPPVKVGLEVVDLLGLLEQAGPVLLLELLLLELELDVLAGVEGLGLGGVDLGVELDVELVRPLQGVGVTLEGDALGLDVELQVGGGDIGDGDGQVDEVLGSIRGAGALGPEDWRIVSLLTSWRLKRSNSELVRVRCVGRSGKGGRTHPREWQWWTL
jgi:hypothetical protein